jgi:hypothetical protein
MDEAFQADLEKQKANSSDYRQPQAEGGQEGERGRAEFEEVPPQVEEEEVEVRAAHFREAESAQNLDSATINIAQETHQPDFDKLPRDENDALAEVEGPSATLPHWVFHVKRFRKSWIIQSTPPCTFHPVHSFLPGIPCSCQYHHPPPLSPLYNILVRPVFFK